MKRCAGLLVIVAAVGLATAATMPPFKQYRVVLDGELIIGIADFTEDGKLDLAVDSLYH